MSAEMVLAPIGACPNLAKKGYAALGACPILAENGHASVGAYPILAKKGHASVGAYPILAKKGHAAIGWITISREIVIPTLEIAFSVSKTTFRKEKKGRSIF